MVEAKTRLDHGPQRTGLTPPESFWDSLHKQGLCLQSGEFQDKDNKTLLGQRLARKHVKRGANVFMNGSICHCWMSHEALELSSTYGEESWMFSSRWT